jgi:hypothetical protein
MFVTCTTHIKIIKILQGHEAFFGKVRIQQNIIVSLELLINYHFLKIDNFFNLLSCSIHVIYILEQVYT